MSVRRERLSTSPPPAPRSERGQSSTAHSSGFSAYVPSPPDELDKDRDRRGHKSPPHKSSPPPPPPGAAWASAVTAASNGTAGGAGGAGGAGSARSSGARSARSVKRVSRDRELEAMLEADFGIARTASGSPTSPTASAGTLLTALYLLSSQHLCNHHYDRELSEPNQPTKGFISCIFAKELYHRATRPAELA
jgi:hypothetical protein